MYYTWKQISEERKLISMPIFNPIGHCKYFLRARMGPQQSDSTTKCLYKIWHLCQGEAKNQLRLQLQLFLSLALFILSTKASLGFFDVTARHATENPALPGAVTINKTPTLNSDKLKKKIKMA